MLTRLSLFLAVTFLLAGCGRTIQWTPEARTLVLEECIRDTKILNVSCSCLTQRIAETVPAKEFFGISDPNYGDQIRKYQNAMSFCSVGASR